MPSATLRFMTTPFHEAMLACIAAGTPPFPLARTLGMRLLAIGEGTATFAMRAVLSEHANPMGTFHGGVLLSLADSAMGFAMGTTLGEGETFGSMEIKSNLFKPVYKGELTAIATMVKRTKRVGYLECEVRDEGGSLVAKVSSTCMVIPASER